MPNANPVAVQLRYDTKEEAAAAAEAVHFTLVALGGAVDLYVPSKGSVITTRETSPQDFGQFTVNAEFALAPPPVGERPVRRIVQGWPAERRVIAPPPDVSHVMIDFETLGRRPGCQVLTLGAVRFSPQGLHETFYVGFATQPQTAAELHVDSDTEAWWAKQSVEARRAVDERDQLHPAAALSEFFDWLSQFGRKVRIWGNGADFDPPIAVAVAEAFGMKVPWDFWNTRCYRTLKSLRRDIPFHKPELAHHALEDAEAQARHAAAILSEMNLWSSV